MELRTNILYYNRLHYQPEQKTEGAEHAETPTARQIRKCLLEEKHQIIMFTRQAHRLCPIVSKNMLIFSKLTVNINKLQIGL